MQRCSVCSQSLTTELCSFCFLAEGLPSVREHDDSFGPYEIVCQIGEGGMGVAYLVEQTWPIQREAALKVLKPGLLASDVIARFEAERQTLALMNHPNIARVFDAGTSTRKRPYFVMEFVDGSPLTEYCDGKVLTIRERLALFMQVCHAVDHAHKKGIIHRDIKPSNILVTEINGAPAPKVIDFGIAKAVGNHLPGSALHTLENRFFGTVGYMSPEQISGSPSRAAVTTDVYSLGVLLYELLCGSLPFDLDRLQEAGMLGAAEIITQEQAPAPGTRLRELVAAPDTARKRGVDLRTLHKLLAGELTWIVQKALHKDPVHRYATAAQLADDVDRYLRNESVQAGPPSSFYRFRRLVSRYRVPLVSAAVSTGAIAAILLFRNASSSVPLQPIPLTAYTGNETAPTFSPDASHVAFTWNGEKQDNYDIYVLRIGDSLPRRLTHDPAVEFSPAWSPNGMWIAFMRARAGRDPDVVLISRQDGSERTLTAARTVSNPEHQRLDWSADGRWLVLPQRDISGGPDRIYALDVDTGEQHPLSSPKTGEYDKSPALSPDGHFLAFIRDANQFNSSVKVLQLSADFRPLGPEQQLDIPGFGAAVSFNFPRWISSQNLIVNVWSGRQNRRLWRIPVSGGGRPQMLGELGDQIGMHAISRSGHRLAFSRGVFDTNIWRFELNQGSSNDARSRSLIASSRFDQQPAISPDGSKIAFESTRTGFSEIWIASQDGSNAAPLTHFEAFAGSPRWSPDGTRIVLDGSRNDHTDADIYIVPVSGGQPKRITVDPSADFMPSWSPDGRWIYFCSTRTGAEEIWRVPADGGKATRITFGGGFESVPAPDGHSIYYSKSNSPVSSLWRVGSDGGQATMIADAVHSRGFDVSEKGLFFFAGSDLKSTELRFLNFDSGKTGTVASFNQFLRERMSVSRRGDYLLYTQVDQQTNDLMLVDQFH
jgi:Tol biopolymer transport system component/serine/threonine protein kinase